MKNIFITGESGTIPRAIKEVIGDNILNDLVPRELKKHQSFKIREPEIDFTDRELLKSLGPIWEQAHVIIHSGAFVGTDYCDANPEETIRTNIQGTKNIVDIANEYHLPLVYFSTTAIFDPKDYSIDRLITESTRKNPKTLYGISKYAGEMIVERECKEDKTIVRPVFGFSDYPHDLHSALTKMIYHAHHGGDLKLLLGKDIDKTYTRVENIASMVLNIIDSRVWNEDFNIGDHWTESKDWNQYAEMIKTSFKNKGIDVDPMAGVEWDFTKDYLHWHQIETTKAVRYGIFSTPVSLQEGIDRTVRSVMYSNDKPYWMQENA